MQPRVSLESLQATPRLNESDEDRFLVPDSMSLVSLKEAVAAVEKQYLSCKKDRLPPESTKWMLWSAVFIRSWIARIQSEPDHAETFLRKTLFVFWWNRGAALKHYSNASHVAYKSRAKGMHKDAQILREHILLGKLISDGQKKWIEKAFSTMLPLVKKQILAIIPPEKPAA